MPRRALLLALVLVTGCQGTLYAGEGGDAGATSSLDAGATPGSDAGALPARDAGPTTGLDGGAEPPPPDAGPAVPPPGSLAPGVTVEQVALFQGVKVTLADGDAARGVDAREVPVVGLRPGRFRIYASGADRPLTAEVRVTIGEETRVFTEARTLSGPSTDGDPSSTFEVDVPGEWLTSEATWSVAIVEPSGVSAPEGTPHDARFPRDGSALALDAIDDTAGLRVVLVPFSWESDGSSRLPDTSPEQVELIEAHFGALFPYASIDIEVHEPLAWSGGLTWRGNVDFGDVNARLVSLRAEDGVDDEVYYYGLLAPATSRSAYCGRSCVTGQAFVVRDPDDARIRVGSGLGFTGEATARTLQHELGHIHGRGHAPCGAKLGIDPAFPHSGGVTGAWGWDRIEDVYYAPDAPDVMGYCDGRWISDYTYAGMFERHLAIQRRSTRAATHARAAERLSFVRVADGRPPEHLRDVTIELPRTGRTRVQWVSAAGRSLGWSDAARLEQSHPHDELFLLPVAPAGAVAFQALGGPLTALPGPR